MSIATADQRRLYAQRIEEWLRDGTLKVKSVVREEVKISGYVAEMLVEITAYDHPKIGADDEWSACIKAQESHFCLWALPETLSGYLDDLRTKEQARIDAAAGEMLHELFGEPED